MGKDYDLIIVGMGPSSIFCAYELIQLKKYKNILLVDQGKRVENRYCPIEKAGKCVGCKPMCNITNGFSGAGAFSDGKLSLYNKEDDDKERIDYWKNQVEIRLKKHNFIDSFINKFFDKVVTNKDFMEFKDRLKMELETI